MSGLKRFTSKTLSIIDVGVRLVVKLSRQDRETIKIANAISELFDK